MKRKQRSGASLSSSKKSKSESKTRRTSNIGSRSRRKNASRRSIKSAKSIAIRGMVLSDDYREFIESLNAHRVRYLVVGAYAVGHFGHPRYTKDLDVWVWLDRANAEKVVTALEQFGFGSLGLKVEDFLSKDTIIQLGYEPDRIDILTDLNDVRFEECFERKVIVSWRGTKVNLISRRDLIRSKQATGRLQDLADIEQLGKKVPPPSLG